MTGIERLRARAAIYACDGWEGDANILKDIADQIERETLPRPLFEDGELVQFGDEILKAGNSAKVDAFVVNPDGSTLIIAGMYRVAVEAGERVKRPAPKVLDADGVPVEVGDEVWIVDDGCPALVESVDGCRVTIRFTDDDGGAIGANIHASRLTHKRPDVDTWERIEADVRKRHCAYFGGKKGHCASCRAGFMAGPCDVLKVEDLVRRCKALAGVE